MPRKISSRMGMTGAGGTITDGVEMGYTTYNYTTIDPSDPYGRNQVESLSDFPQFTRREEWWQGKTDAAGAPTAATTKYDYSRTVDSSTEVATVKYVDKNCEEVTTTGTDSGQLSFGSLRPGYCLVALFGCWAMRLSLVRRASSFSARRAAVLLLGTDMSRFANPIL